MSEGYDPVAWERLRRQWGLTVLTAVGIAIAGYVFLSDWWTRRHGLQWMVTSGVVLTYELWLLWRYLDQNRRESAGLLLDSLGVATAATLTRGLLTAAVAGFIVLPSRRAKPRGSRQDCTSLRWRSTGSTADWHGSTVTRPCWVRSSIWSSTGSVCSWPDCSAPSTVRFRCGIWRSDWLGPRSFSANGSIVDEGGPSDRSPPALFAGR
jgi:hypothetical protein